jgi:hypothetical protein
VVGSVVNSVDTDGVNTELLELGNVALTAGLVGNGILCIRCAAWSLSVRHLARVAAHLTGLVVDTTDVEALVALPEGCTKSVGRSPSFLKLLHTIALDGDGCDISALLNGCSRASNRSSESAGDGSDSNSLHGGGIGVSDEIRWFVVIVARRAFQRRLSSGKRQTVKGRSKREDTPGRKVRLEERREEEVAHENSDDEQVKTMEQNKLGRTPVIRESTLSVAALVVAICGMRDAGVIGCEK